MRYQTEAIPLDKFDPESDGYDYRTATDAGETADDTGHWGSLDPRTGMVLKGKSHPTWSKTVDAEEKIGRTIIKADDGRYYSVKLPRYLAEAEPVKASQEPPASLAEQAQFDYDFAVENNMTLGGVDAIKREFGTLSGLQKKIPFAGGLFGVAENVELIDTVKRFQSNDYEWRYGLEADRAQFEMPQEEYERQFGDKERWIGQFKEQDKKTIAAHLKYISADKTYMNKVITGASVLPTWMIEFAATGGLASLGDDIAIKAGEKILGQYATTTAGKIALKSAGITAGGVTRSFGLGHRTLETMTQRQMDVVLNLREEEGWATSALMAWGDTAIEAVSEQAGEGLTGAGGALLGKLPFGSKLASGLEKAWIAATGGSKGEFVRKMASKGGYSNILGEIGEERLGTALRAITSVDDFGLGSDSSMIERLKAGIIQDYENIGVEIGVLSFPAGGQFVLSKVANFGTVKPDFDSTQFDQTADATPPPAGEPAMDGTLAGVATETAQIEPQAAIEPQVTVPPMEVTESAPVTAGAVPPTDTATIARANTQAEVDQVVNQIITQGVDPAKTSARQANLNEDRADLGLDGIASPERQGWQRALQSAKDRNVINQALRIASEINSSPRALNVEETAGLVMKAAQLKREHRELMREMEGLDDPADIYALSAKLDMVEGEFDAITQALYKSGTEKGRALASQKLTINQDFDLISLKNRAKKIKGKELTAKEAARIEQLAKDLELQQRENDILQQRINELMAKQLVKQGSVARYSRMNLADRNTELDTLISRTRQLLEEGCYN